MTPSLTIAIPTYNSGPRLDQLLSQLKTLPPRSKKIFIIDSSSTDQTLSIIRHHQLPHLVIPKSQFSHSATRNLFLKHLTTPFIYFCTQDILPANPNFLQLLLHSLQTHPQAVAAFGPQLAYPQTPLFFKIETELLFYQLNHLSHNQPLLQNQTNFPSTNPFLWYFISNNNALYRANFLRQHPFPSVPYGEDLAQGQFIIQHGLTKIYHPQATIFHSHTYTLKQYAQRQRQDFQLYSHLTTYRRPTLIPKTKAILTASVSPREKISALLFMIATYFIKLKLFLITKFKKLITSS